MKKYKYLCILISFLLFGCNSKTPLILTVPSEDYINYLENTVVKDFKLKYPNVMIKYNAIGDKIPYDYESQTKYYIDKHSDKTDVFIGIPSHQYNQINKSTMEIDYLKEKNSTSDDYFSSIYDLLRMDGAIYASPVGFYNSFLLVNNTIAKNFEVNIQDIENTNWEHILKISQEVYSLSKKEFSGLSLGNNKDNIVRTIELVTYPIHGNMYIKEKTKYELNKEKIEVFKNLFHEGLTQKYVNTDLDNFFQGNTLFAFVNLYDLQFYQNYYDSKINISYSIINAPHFNKDDSYIIPGDMLGISKLSTNEDLANKFIIFFINNYYKYYDSGSFGWFSVINNKKQINFVENFNLKNEIIYPPMNISQKNNPDYSWLEMQDLNDRLYKCYNTNRIAENDENTVKAIVNCFSNN